MADKKKKGEYETGIGARRRQLEMLGVGAKSRRKGAAVKPTVVKKAPKAKPSKPASSFDKLMQRMERLQKGLPKKRTKERPKARSKSR